MNRSVAVTPSVPFQGSEVVWKPNGLWSDYFSMEANETSPTRRGMVQQVVIRTAKWRVMDASEVYFSPVNCT